MRPLSAFSGKNAAIVSDSGFQTPVVWEGQELNSLPQRVRIRVTFAGQQSTRVRLHYNALIF